MQNKTSFQAINTLLVVCVLLCGCEHFCPQQACPQINCPPPQKKDAIAQEPQNEDRITLGEAEYIKLNDNGAVLKARIDTGAKLTSIRAEKISTFERDGKPWVSFELTDNQGKKTQHKKPLVGYTQIKQHGKAPLKRPEITTTLKLGQTTQQIKVNLANRKGFEYPILIGRNFLDGFFVVDTSKKYTQGMPKQ